ncbi:right-handed parallel beta-helix repeat-containing protein [Symbiobacterium terraclitae]|uniref:right-handed parallel beta-helix repeat-containing protein n=1 Tax=Symbiobacterium terraclitae TaxID=557451 RepID=UPI0035B55B5C
MAVLRVPADFRTVGEAVARAAPGDTIRVAGGVYAEAVRIEAGKDRLAIVGAGPGSTILQGPGSGVGFLIEGSGGVTIAGFTVTGFAEGIMISTSDNVIRDVTVSNCTSVGISAGNRALRNLFLGVAAGGNGREGLVASGQNAYVLSGEFFDNGGEGVNLIGFRHVAMGNRSRGNSAGLAGVNTNAVVLTGNSLTGNGAGLLGEGDLLYANTMVRNQRAGGELIFGAFSVVLENEFPCNYGPGLFLAAVGAFRFLRNAVEENGQHGMEMVAEATGNVVDENEIKQNGAAGIRLEPLAVENSIRRNELKGNNPDIQALPPADTDNVFDENRVK